MLHRSVAVAIVAACAVVLMLAVRPGHPSAPTLEMVEATAARWVGVGHTDAPRRDEGEWEVDVSRPDGSLVEVTLGDRLELRGFDEEYGPGQTPAADELEGAARERVIDPALEAGGPGRVVSVEREFGNEMETDIRRPDGSPRRGRARPDAASPRGRSGGSRRRMTTALPRARCANPEQDVRAGRTAPATP